MLAALGSEEELPLHLRGALRSGVTRAEVPRCFSRWPSTRGAPRANRAFAAARDILDGARLRERQAG